ncbi:MAG TPA: hypothetical protein VNR11_09055 [Xanthobacteraceae bacterium]|nr:hypothetical protein [Xanthobacteraceae bacterium]
MTPEALFLERSDQLATLIDSNKEIELLDLAGNLRQLLADKHALVDTVNTSNIRLHFHVGKFRNEPDQFTVLQSLEDGLDPQARSPHAPSTHLSKEQFLAHPVTYFRGEVISVRNLIRYMSNVAGGVHYDPQPRPEYGTMAMLTGRISMVGLPLGVAQLRAVGRVTWRGLGPLIEDVRKRV